MRRHPILWTISIIGFWYAILVFMAAIATKSERDVSNLAQSEQNADWISAHPAAWIAIVVLCLTSIVTFYFWPRRTKP